MVLLLLCYFWSFPCSIVSYPDPPFAAVLDVLYYQHVKRMRLHLQMLRVTAVWSPKCILLAVSPDHLLHVTTPLLILWKSWFASPPPPPTKNPWFYILKQVLKKIKKKSHILHIYHIIMNYHEWSCGSQHGRGICRGVRANPPFGRVACITHLCFYIVNKL